MVLLFCLLMYFSSLEEDVDDDDEDVDVDDREAKDCKNCNRMDRTRCNLSKASIRNWIGLCQ